jgi:hypothetical protein
MSSQTRSYNNQLYAEGTVTSTPLVITYEMPVRRLIIINDSTAGDLMFKFNDSEVFARLKPGEQFNNELRIPALIYKADTTDVEYRIFAYG